MMRFGIVISIVILISGMIQSQTDLAIGQWKSHLPYQNGKLVTQSENKVIYATDWSLVAIDKTELTANFISKVEGLSDVGIAAIKYDGFNEQLVIAYSNSNIDIFSNDKLINLPNIKTNTTILGDRQIYDIHIADEEFVYFATGFGIVQLNSKTKNFGFTTFTGIKVNDICSKDKILYIATDDGIYFAQVNPETNLGDFNNWDLLGPAFGLPLVYEGKTCEVFQGILYVGIDKDVWKEQDNGQMEVIYTETDEKFDIQYLSAGKSKLILGIKDDRFASRVLFFDEADSYVEDGNGCSDRAVYAIEDQFQRIWYADEFDDFRYNENFSDECKRLKFNSIKTHKVGDMSIKDNTLYVSSAGVTDNFGVTGSREGFFFLEDREWTNLNESNFSPIKDNDLLSFFPILSHPEDNLLYIGTFWGGLMELNRDNDEVRVFREHNSSLGVAVGDVQRVRISGLYYDLDNNLWISNFGAAKPISVFTNEGNWHAFSANSDTKLEELAIDVNGFKWFVVNGTAGGMLVFDSGQNVEDPTDDRQYFFNANNSAITTNEVHCVAVDKEGDVWVGTSEGPVVFECGSDLFEGNCEGTRRKVLQDSIAAFLLSTETINAIEVDGANRKWFGSKNGIFVQSPSGEDQIAHFTIDNSPLFDNNIIDLVYNGQTGEMYIASDKGLQSLRTETTEGESRHSNSVFAFPNPVRPDYEGPIAITGLARDAQVKITDVNGRLVFETQALGGQAIWNGRDYNGRRANTGVYLVFSSSTDSFDDPDSFVTKIMIIQ